MFILGTCATCEDVKDFFEKYNVPGLERARFPIADRTGASMVVEYGQAAVQFVDNKTEKTFLTHYFDRKMRIEGKKPKYVPEKISKILQEELVKIIEKLK